MPRREHWGWQPSLVLYRLCRGAGREVSWAHGRGVAGRAACKVPSTLSLYVQQQVASSRMAPSRMAPSRCAAVQHHELLAAGESTPATAAMGSEPG